jgi:hypothetical protein
MTQTGYGVSRAYTEGVLKYCVESGGKNNLLPHSFEACQKVAEGLIDTLQGKRKTYIIDIPIPLEVRLLVRMLDDIHAHIFTYRTCTHLYIYIYIYVPYIYTFIYIYLQHAPHISIYIYFHPPPVVGGLRSEHCPL